MPCLSYNTQGCEKSTVMGAGTINPVFTIQKKLSPLRHSSSHSVLFTGTWKGSADVQAVSYFPNTIPSPTSCPICQGLVAVNARLPPFPAMSLQSYLCCFNGEHPNTEEINSQQILLLLRSSSPSELQFTSPRVAPSCASPWHCTWHQHSWQGHIPLPSNGRFKCMELISQEGPSKP